MTLTECVTKIENPTQEVEIWIPTCTHALHSTASVEARDSPGELRFIPNMIIQVAIELNRREVLRKKNSLIEKKTS